MQLELFHGTRQRFETFDASFKGTGESGDIDACWFTDNFNGASSHALYKNRNPGAPLVYRCELLPGALIADHSKPLVAQPAIAERLRRYTPVGLSCSLGLARPEDAVLPDLSGKNHLQRAPGHLW